jgi:hypothetical protein
MISSTNVNWRHRRNRVGETDRIDCRECRTECLKEPSDHFHSVEFSINGIKLLYQSRIWNSTTASMFALVKEDSIILDRLHVGEVMSMKFYTTDNMCQTRNFDTEIEYITKDRNGRFKGHFLVGLKILSEQKRPVQAVQLS